MGQHNKHGQSRLPSRMARIVPATHGGMVINFPFFVYFNWTPYRLSWKQQFIASCYTMLSMLFTRVEMNSTQEITGRETLIIPDWNLQTAAISQLVSRHATEHELLIPCMLFAVAFDVRLELIFAPSIYGHYSTVRQNAVVDYILKQFCRYVRTLCRGLYFCAISLYLFRIMLYVVLLRCMWWKWISALNFNFRSNKEYPMH